MKFTEIELQCIGNALDRAAERYKLDKEHSQAAGYGRLADQFERQEEECYALRGRLAEEIGW